MPEGWLPAAGGAAAAGETAAEGTAREAAASAAAPAGEDDDGRFGRLGDGVGDAPAVVAVEAGVLLDALSFASRGGLEDGAAGG